jgi:hypothetical protein
MKNFLVIIGFLFTSIIHAQHISVVGNGWASNSINTVIFRKNSVVSYKNFQFVAYYDSTAHIVIAKRKLNTDNWQMQQTKFIGNIKDAHNCISIMIDGDGYLHIAFNHHGNQLHYVKSVQPLWLEFTDELPMTGNNETKITYPEFYKLSNGDLFFLYRDGASGNGNVILNRYSLSTKKWERINSNLIDGANKRNAYWQTIVDNKDVLHISWVWRESADVASNHDMCYAKSEDGGITWKKSNGEIYSLPITISNAEVVKTIPQKSELINQTSMCVDANNNPFIATYYKFPSSAIPQYHLIYFNGKEWNDEQVSSRTTAFSLSGVGTKKIPVARPQVMIDKNEIIYVFRDEERSNKVSVFIKKKNFWRTMDLSNEDVGAWEPTYDTELWKTKKQLHLFVQYTSQGDGEKTVNIKMQPVKIVEWKIKGFAQ